MMRTIVWLASLILVFIGAVVFVSIVFYNVSTKMYSEDAIQRCVELCKQAKELGQDLSNGPCLSDNIAPNWVCDVAHWPRKDVDNDPKNQCEAFRKGKATHFVEVDENCNVIRVM